MSNVRAEFFDRLTDPRAVPILMRHAIPVLGVFVFDWSVLEVVAALLLDAVSTLWVLGAVGAYFAAKEVAPSDDTSVLAYLEFWAAVFGMFLVLAGLLTFMVGVPASFLLPVVLRADLDPMTLVTSGWLPRAFGAMLACQLPGFAQRVRAAQAAGPGEAKRTIQGEVGFVVHRVMMLASLSSLLYLFGRYGLDLLVIVAQVLGAGTELMRDHYIGHLMAPERPGGASSAAATRRYRRRCRRR